MPQPLNTPKIIESVYGYHCITKNENGSMSITWHPRNTDKNELDRILADVLAQPDVMALVKQKMIDRMNQASGRNP